MAVSKLIFVDGQLYDQSDNLVKLPEGQLSMLIGENMLVFDTEAEQQNFSEKLQRTINEVVTEQAEDIPFYRPQ